MTANHSTVLYRNLKATPPMIVRGQGVYLYDAQGRRYLDGSASASVVGIGHGRSEIWRALVEVGDEVTFVYGSTFTHPWQEKLATAIIELSPPGMSAVYFTSGGSEANEFGLEARPAVFRRDRQAAEVQGDRPLGRLSRRDAGGAVVVGANRLAAPVFAAAAAGDAHRAALRLPLRLLRGRGAMQPRLRRRAGARHRQRGPGDGGDVHRRAGDRHLGVRRCAASRAYYARIREICDKYDVLFVADEVLCGYGRCGRPFAISEWAVEPDIITLGKAIASGYAPLAAMVVSDKIRQALSDGTGRFVHGLTYSGTPSSCFIGLKVHEIMRREGLFTRPASIGRLSQGKARVAGPAPRDDRRDTRQGPAVRHRAGRGPHIAGALRPVAGGGAPGGRGHARARHHHHCRHQQRRLRRRPAADQPALHHHARRRSTS